VPVTSRADAIALTGYVLATPFTVYPPLFKRMWHGDLRLLAVQELGVALIVAGWALRGDRGPALVNGAYGVGLAVAYAVAGGRRR
jgi:hypothetical protein